MSKSTLTRWLIIERERGAISMEGAVLTVMLFLLAITVAGAITLAATGWLDSLFGSPPE